MEISVIRKRVRDAIDRAKRRRAMDRRTRTDDARRAFEAFLEHTAVPMFRQIDNVLRVEGYAFTLHTPPDSVRLMSDRRAEDYLELRLDTSGEAPQALGRVSHARASGVFESEQPLGDPATLTEEELLSWLLRALEPLVER